MRNMTEGYCDTCEEPTQIMDMCDCCECYNKKEANTYKLNKNGDWCSAYNMIPLRHKAHD